MHDKYDYYQHVKETLQSQGFLVNPPRKIKSGIQFLVFLDTLSEILRIIDTSDGVKLDFSAVKDDTVTNAIQAILTPIESSSALGPIEQPLSPPDIKPLTTQDPDNLIAISTCGKEDYFGPLVVCSVLMSTSVKDSLSGVGIKPVEELSSSGIVYLAKLIMSKCKHAVIIMGNQSYNELYDNFENEHHLLSWAQLKVIEDTYRQQVSRYVLTDVYGNGPVIGTSLRAKQLDITLLHDHHLHNNFAFNCASILATYSQLDQLEKMNRHYQFNFPKGQAKKSLQSAIKFINKHGKMEMASVAKLHFKVTELLESHLSNKEA